MVLLKPAAKAPDAVYGTLKSTIWTTIEANTGIFCACMPTLKAPIAAWIPSSLRRSPPTATNGGPASGDIALYTIGGSDRQGPSGQDQQTSKDSASSAEEFRPRFNVRMPYANSDHTGASTHTFASQEAAAALGKDEEDRLPANAPAIELGTISKKVDVKVQFEKKPAKNDEMEREHFEPRYYMHMGRPAAPSPSQERLSPTVC